MLFKFVYFIRFTLKELARHLQLDLDILLNIDTNADTKRFY